MLSRKRPDTWFADYAAFGVEQGPFGMDSVIRVPKAA